MGFLIRVPIQGEEHNMDDASMCKQGYKFETEINVVESAGGE